MMEVNQARKAGFLDGLYLSGTIILIMSTIMQRVKGPLLILTNRSMIQETTQV
jgi:hypothetical protein